MTTVLISDTRLRWYVTDDDEDRTVLHVADSYEDAEEEARCLRRHGVRPAVVGSYTPPVAPLIRARKGWEHLTR